MGEIPVTRNTRFQSDAHVWGSSVEYRQTRDRYTPSFEQNLDNRSHGGHLALRLDGPCVCVIKHQIMQGKAVSCLSNEEYRAALDTLVAAAPPQMELYREDWPSGQRQAEKGCGCGRRRVPSYRVP